MRDEIEIAGGEIIFFVVSRIIRDMHLAVAPDDRAGFIEDDAGVVVNAGGAALEDRRDDDDFVGLRDCAESFGGRAGDWLGEIEKFRILGLAWVVRAEEFLGAYDLGAAFGGLVDSSDGLFEVEARLGRAAHLEEADCYFVESGWHLVDQIAGDQITRYGRGQRKMRGRWEGEDFILMRNPPWVPHLLGQG